MSKRRNKAELKRFLENPDQLDLGESLGDTPAPAGPETAVITYRLQGCFSKR